MKDDDDIDLDDLGALKYAVVATIILIVALLAFEVFVITWAVFFDSTPPLGWLLGG